MEITKTKQCKSCGEFKDLNEFYVQNKIKVNGDSYVYYPPECKVCASKRTLTNRNQNREENLAKMREYYKEYITRPEPREKHREVMRKRNKEGKTVQWQRNNKDKIKFYSEKRKSKQHEISRYEWMDCKEYFEYECAYCGLPEEVHRELYKQQLHKEHVEHNGANDLSNCVPACRICNSSKWENSIDEWYNNDNPNFTEERINRINKWLSEDYLKFIEKIKI